MWISVRCKIRNGWKHKGTATLCLSSVITAARYRLTCSCTTAQMSQLLRIINHYIDLSLFICTYTVNNDFQGASLSLKLTLFITFTFIFRLKRYTILNVSNNNYVSIKHYYFEFITYFVFIILFICYFLGQT